MEEKCGYKVNRAKNCIFALNPEIELIFPWELLDWNFSSHPEAPFRGEYFCEIRDHPGYYISTKGRVWNNSSQRFLNLQYVSFSPYPMVSLMTEKGQRLFPLHRLLAITFIPNPHGYPIVRHLNDDPNNYQLENLAWGTQKDNGADRARNNAEHGYK